MSALLHKWKVLQNSKIKEAFTCFQWQPTPVSLPGKSHGQRSLVGYSPWSHKESDTTEWPHFLSFPLRLKKKKKIKGMINKDNLLRNDSWPLRQPRILTSWYSHLCITPLGVCLGLQDGSLWTRLAAMSWEPRHVATGDPPHIRLQLSLFCRTLLVSGKCSW